MWITFGFLVALSYAGANGAFIGDELFLEEGAVGDTSIILNALQPKDTVDVEEDVLDQYELLDNIDGRNSVANTIRNMLESFRDVVINGNDDLPVLDPFRVAHLGPYVYTYTGVRLTGNIRNLQTEGLRWYVVNDVRFDLLRLTTGVRLTVPWIIITGTYDATAVIAFVSHRSGGNFRFFINRIDVDVDARLGTNILGGHLLLRSLNIKIDVHDVQTQVTGLTGSSVLNSIINGLMQSVSRDFINNEMEYVSKMISEAAFDAINEFLKDFTLDDLR